MAIRTVVTRGFGTGSFDGTIPLVARRGYYSAEPVVTGPDVICWTSESLTGPKLASESLVCSTLESESLASASLQSESLTSPSLSSESLTSAYLASESLECDD